MLRSLVGSEMCIRDSLWRHVVSSAAQRNPGGQLPRQQAINSSANTSVGVNADTDADTDADTVSYTHLTLPTIYSV